MHIKRAFTLVELLVVIAIIGVLVALLLPAVQAAREAARRSQCTNNLKQLGLAVHNYESAKKGLPPSRVNCHHGSWYSELWPYIEQGALAGQWDPKKSYHYQPLANIRTQIAAFYCPSRRSAGPDQLSSAADGVGDGRLSVPHRSGALGDYAACAGDGDGNFVSDINVGGVFLVPKPYGTRASDNGGIAPCDGTDPDLLFKGMTLNVKLKSVTDGASNTILIGEKHLPLQGFGLYTFGDSSIYNVDGIIPMIRFAGPGFAIALSPDELQTAGQYTKFGSVHPGLCQFAFVDGSIRALDVSIDTQLLGYLADRNDEQVANN